MNVREYEGTSGDVDDDGFGPIFIAHRGRDVIRGIGGLRDRLFEITQLEVLDEALTPGDVVVLVSRVWLVYYANDYYRDKADRVALVWADGSRTLTFEYPPATS